MMSEPEDSASVIDLELIAQEELRKRNKEKAARQAQLSQPPPQPSMEPEPQAPQPAVQPVEKVPSPTKVIKKLVAKKKRAPLPSDPRAREIARKHEAERKSIQKDLDALAKKRDRDIRELMDKALRDHYELIDKERSDYLELLRELKKSLEAQTQGITESCQQVVTTAAQDEVERMVNWFHEEFMKELNKKNREFEDLKATAEKQVNKMTEENDNKSKKIMQLDDKIKELAASLPADVRKALFAELGLEHLEPVKVVPKEPKRERKGLFSRLSQVFKRTPKKAAKPVKVRTKQTKKAQKRVLEEEVVAN